MVQKDDLLGNSQEHVDDRKDFEMNETMIKHSDFLNYILCHLEVKFKSDVRFESRLGLPDQWPHFEAHILGCQKVLIFQGKGLGLICDKGEAGTTEYPNGGEEALRWAQSVVQDAIDSSR
ncbi:MAG: hypothetical protein VR70_08015 [Rhodospirillaceae bacterium BRH_c57]|nr:MAG: hypothetical protein VR70_08015 [Rhodospirillaceae bacterium BRH_c57]